MVMYMRWLLLLMTSLMELSAAKTEKPTITTAEIDNIEINRRRYQQEIEKILKQQEIIINNANEKASRSNERLFG